MSTIIRTFLVLAFLLTNILFSNAYAIHFPKPPNNHFYVDAANLLQPKIKNEINQIARNMWQERNIPFFVVTIPSLITQGAIHYTIKDYATALFKFWGIGSQEKSYGILLLISKAERMVSIILGSGFGHSFDMQKNHIMKDMATADFDRDDFSDGILKGVINLNTMTASIKIPKQSQLMNTATTKPAHESLSTPPLLKIIVTLSMIIFILTMLNSNQRKKLSAIKKDDEDKESNS